MFYLSGREYFLVKGLLTSRMRLNAARMVWNHSLSRHTSDQHVTHQDHSGLKFIAHVQCGLQVVATLTPRSEESEVTQRKSRNGMMFRGLRATGSEALKQKTCIHKSRSG